MRSSLLVVVLGSALTVGLTSTIAAAQSESAPAESPRAESPPPAIAPDPSPASPAPAPAPVQEDTSVEPPEAGKKKDDGHDVYISFSPFHLLFPLVEVTGEIRLHRHIGVAAIAGYGSVRPEGSSVRFSAFELGGQFLGYAVGHFDHGMQLGLEVLYLGVSGSTGSGRQEISGIGQGLAVGPLVGYKFASKIGFSLNIQGGVQYMAARAEASSISGARATGEESRLIPLLNLNLGWSF